MKKLYLLLPIIFLFLNSQAQTGTWDWGHNGVFTLNNGPIVQADIWCTGADVFGNCYLTGPFWGNLTVDGQPLNNSTTDDQVLTIKYDSSGNLKWVAQSTSLNSSFFSYASTYDIAADNFGSLYITGDFGDTMIFSKDTLFAPELSSDMFLLKYDKSGNVRWSRQAIGNYRADRSIGTALTTDKTNHIYVAGTFDDTTTLGSTQLVNKNEGLFIAKYDTGGNLIWAKHTTKFAAGSIAFYGNPAGPYSIKTDVHNNLLVTGLFTDTLTYGSVSLYAPANEQSLFVLKIDSNGNLKWAVQGLNDSSFETNPVYVATDNAGDVYCGGTYAGTGSFGSKTLPSSIPNTNFFIVKYDTSGNPLWVKTTNNSSRWTSDKLVNDNNNHLYVCGNSGIGGGNTINYDNTSITTSQSDNGDGFSVLFKTDTAGNLLCSSLVAGGADDFNGMAVDTSGKYVFLGGDLLEQMTLDTIVLYKGGSQFGPQEVPFLARWQPCVACDITVAISPQSATVCSGQSVTLYGSGGTSYNWSPSTGLNTTTGDSVIASPTITVTYTVTGSDALGCMGSGTDVVYIIPAPNKPSITVSKTGDSLISSATSDNQWFFDDQPINDSTRQVLIIKGHATGWFTVTVTNPANGCSTTSDSVSNISTNVNQLSVNNNQLTIYPNPTSGEFAIQFSGNQNGSLVEVYNIIGEKIYQSVISNSQKTINLSSQPVGMYFVYLKSDEGVEVAKLLLTK